MIEIQKPVFITGLPRAGTTLLLEICVAFGGFASHCYRDMPFILTPIIWNRFAKKFRQEDIPRERAHGDGMLVSIDSPEAFEEVVWKAFWKECYENDRIIPWDDDEKSDFSVFLREHIRKIIAVRSKGHESEMRYISKNNCNIARLHVLRRIFPDAVYIIPFRHPLQHAASLLRQHCNFLKIHREDRFARDYMAAIGHYDFGANLRPVDFGKWIVSARSSDPTTLSFWVEYWTASYRHLLRQASTDSMLLCYEAFCEEPGRALRRLADFIKIKERDRFLEQKARIREMRNQVVEARDLNPKSLQIAESLYADLRRASIEQMAGA